jgi:hypothetical protein
MTHAITLVEPKCSECDETIPPGHQYWNGLGAGAICIACITHAIRFILSEHPRSTPAKDPDPT